MPKSRNDIKFRVIPNETFTRSKLTQHHVVYKQPNNPLPDDFRQARGALAACPVSAIRTMLKGENHGLVELTPKEIETSKAYAINPKVNGIPLPFPLKLSENIWLIGHYSDKSFGAIPYFNLARGEDTVDGEKREISIMVDVPKFSKSAIAAVKKVLGDNVVQIIYFLRMLMIQLSTMIGRTSFLR